MSLIFKILRRFKAIIKRIITIFQNFIALSKRFGFIGAIKRYIKAFIYRVRQPEKPNFYDVLFINGCFYNLPHPIRYRVDHQMEQLIAQGVKCKKIDVWNLKKEDVNCARTFIFYRLIYDDFVGEFIDLAKKLNKKVIFDIDDLLIDTKYTDQIPYVQNMPKNERESYDYGVKQMGKTLTRCGSAITTTEALANELKNYVDEVFVNRNVASMEMQGFSEDALKHKISNNDDIKIGYFSGSITHNDDVDMIVPSLIRVLKERKNVKFCVVGEASIPDSLKDYSDRIEFLPFTDWKNLPNLIASVDINIAPLVRSVFNESKSENKWTEASLVKVPTIASNLGAFKFAIEDGETGILCDDEDDWYEAFLSLIDDADKRARIGENAYKIVSEKYVTYVSGKGIANYIKSNRKPNYLFLIHNIDNTGGCMVIKRHASILQKAGYDVSLAVSQKKIRYTQICEDGATLPVLRAYSFRNKDEKNIIIGQIDNAVATFWVTNNCFKRLDNLINRLYLVQGYEVDFCDYGEESRALCCATYTQANVKYITISKWCQKWLKDKFKRDAKYAPNCIDLNEFSRKIRYFEEEKTRILIEGDCFAPNKNIDEAFKIANKLDKNKYEIWYLSYGNRKKNWYEINRFISNIPHEQVHEVYESCHILLKTSLAESFSYPPLEMMATGGYVVAIPNEGNVEYLKDNNNCLMFEQGQTNKAIELINNIANDKTIRNTLEKNSKLTVEDREWESHTKDIVKMYSC